MSRGSGLDRLRLQDMSDREVLLAMLDVSSDWVDAHEMAKRLGIRGENPHRFVSSRLAWLRRYGAVERELLWDEHGNPLTHSSGVQKTSQQWRVTDIGKQIALGKLTRSQANAIESMNDASAILMTRALAERAHYSGSATASKLVEREWKHQWMRA